MSPSVGIPTVEAIEENPRNYCLCLRVTAFDEKGEERVSKFYFSPAAHAVAGMMRAYPGQLDKRIKAGQRWQRRYNEEGRELRFPWPQELLDDNNPGSTVREAIRGREGTYTLWDSSPGELIDKLIVKGFVASADVRSKSSRDPNTSKIYQPHIRSIFLDGMGDPNLIEMSCTCPEAGWVEGEKGGLVLSRMECLHQAAMLDELYSIWHGQIPRQLNRKNVSLGSTPFNPFRFAENWAMVKGVYRARDPAFASLEQDVIVARYVDGNGYYEINRKLANIPWVLSRPMIEGIKRGDVTFEVLSQGKKRRKMAREMQNALKGLYSDMAGILRRRGYTFQGRCLEFGEPALHFENGGNSVNLVFSDNLPPYYVVRTMPDSEARPFHKDATIQDPYSLLGKRPRLFDDRTKRFTEARVELPSAFRIPELDGFVPIRMPDLLKEEYRKQIKKAFRENPEPKLKYARLLF